MDHFETETYLARTAPFRKVDALSNPRTEEQIIQGTRTGDLAYMAYIELERLDNLGTEVWHDAAFGTERSAAMREKLIGLKRERWWLDFSKWTPEWRVRS